MKQLVVCVGLWACGDDGGPSHLDDAPPLPDARVCAPISGAGTMHPGALSTAETWTAAGSPHILPFDTSITAAITVEACATVQIGANKSVTVRANGSLTTLGEEGLPVRIERLVADDSWAQLSAVGGGTLSFTHTVITGGGDRLNTVPSLAAMIDVAGTTPVTEPILHADHLTLSDSESQGLSLHDGGGFDATSTAVTIHGSVGAPILVWPRAMGTIPDGDYSGNTLDAIVLTGQGGPASVRESTTMHARGTKYRVGTQDNAVLDVAGTASAIATLTIEPGVTVEFLTGGVMHIEPSSGTNVATGALIAVGTSTSKITFTSAVVPPTAGDWYGIWFGQTPDPASRMQHTTVRYAGRTSVSGSDSCIPQGQTGPNDGAIRIISNIPATVFITETLIENSARHGIDRGYRSDLALDFVTPNSFTAVPGCFQTLNKAANGACPTTVTCP